MTTAKPNQRAKMQAETLATFKQYEKDAVDRIRRIGIISADLEVKGKQKGGGRGGANGLGESVSGGGDVDWDYETGVLPFLASQY